MKGIEMLECRSEKQHYAVQALQPARNSDESRSESLAGVRKRKE